MTDIPNTREIVQYFHCGQCLKSKPAEKSPKEFSRISVGFTELGIQVWCDRHDCNIVHIDFEGHQHPANTGRAA